MSKFEELKNEMGETDRVVIRDDDGTITSVVGSVSLVQMVASGAGVTLLPKLSLPIEERTPDLAFVPLTRPAPSRTIGLAWRATSPRSEEFRALGKLLVP